MAKSNNFQMFILIANSHAKTIILFLINYVFSSQIVYLTNKQGCG